MISHYVLGTESEREEGRARERGGERDGTQVCRTRRKLLATWVVWRVNRRKNDKKWFSGKKAKRSREWAGIYDLEIETWLLSEEVYGKG